MIDKIQISTTDGSCDAYLAKPSEPGPWPGVIFIPDAIGPRDALKVMAERLAAEGYSVLLPNIFYRERLAPLVTDVIFPAKENDLPEILRQIMPLVEQFNPSKVLFDIATYITFLKAEPQLEKTKLGIFGYCMGGALAIRAAAKYPDEFGAVASFHAGGLVTVMADSPHKLLPAINAEIYVGHADHDPHMTASEIEEFDHALRLLSVSATAELYAGAHHHFTMADLPAYNADAAEKHFSALLDLFRRRLTAHA